MEIEEIAQRYGALPSEVMAAPMSLIRHFRLIRELEGALGGPEAEGEG